MDKKKVKSKSRTRRMVLTVVGRTLLMVFTVVILLVIGLSMV